MDQSIDHTPGVPLHRVLAPLNFERVAGKPVCGDIKWRTVNGVKTAFLLAPRANKPIRGVSFFEPSPELSNATHTKLGKQVYGCGITPTQIPLPEQLRFLNDGPLELIFEGDDQPTVCGQHWELFTTIEMSSDEFAARYQELQAQMQVCGMAAGAGPAELRQVDKDHMPSDKLTYVAVEALDALADSSPDLNTKQFSSLFANHLRAADWSFEEVLQHGNMSEMAATALQCWVTRNPEAQVNAWKALRLLGDMLEFTPEPIAYKPYWEVHPFQFLDGEYSDKLYDQEVKTCAQAYVDDEELKKKVQHVASELFAEMAKNKSAYESRPLQHDGLTFEVRCAQPSTRRPEA